MSKSRFLAFIPICVLGALAALPAQDTGSGTTADRVQLKLDTEEADAVLAILDKRVAGTAVDDGDWKRLFVTEAYIRLKKREAGMHRDFTDDDFEKFVLSPELVAKAPSLRHTLDTWRNADLAASARRVLAYLPDQAHIKGEGVSRHQAEDQ
ncbi:MAG: hypothetical protein ACYDDS_14745 [Candidatus Sulfotelmatobacter sp.]